MLKRVFNCLNGKV
ncbi:ste20-related kinase [Schistosoma mansoni]|nr:ste20-related kinase [Schistosoma mansoni]|eukprot:XP_018644647.1 ste20-related kinase [Schistosoma mansoni]